MAKKQGRQKIKKTVKLVRDPRSARLDGREFYGVANAGPLLLMSGFGFTWESTLIPIKSGLPPTRRCSTWTIPVIPA